MATDDSFLPMYWYTYAPLFRQSFRIMARWLSFLLRSCEITIRKAVQRQQQGEGEGPTGNCAEEPRTVDPRPNGDITAGGRSLHTSSQVPSNPHTHRVSL